ncbi:pyridoxamine 5'-phosphate oxidase family protein [Piscirickettsia litoralis]|uniref:Pyridoxamine 5'-phosphate oxidase N-terminal domain-containing protein n=1 Tax=Piscirickettsia litoralis TaxID=1891921 RepID=A0ABX2ZZQ8_9GAMM|nr:pyridoxamine 5'-phosphate oxidase family protein [Piscirickettsia litoralis]ODN41874.1 hypothetical protein BGC07_01445 [Piscirickettsia litoralis]
MRSPFDLMREWVDQECKLGSQSPNRAILSTIANENEKMQPHSRVVALREFDDRGFLFFTSKKTRKYTELVSNPQASMVIWLELQQRQVVIEGNIQLLNNEENHSYWQALPKHNQLKFTAYGPHTNNEITSTSQLDVVYQELSKQYQDQENLPLSEYYKGSRLIPNRLMFYTLESESFSEFVEYIPGENEEGWQSRLLGPC